MGLLSAAVVGTVGAGILVVGPFAAPVLPLLGFSSTGIVAGSLAAGAQAYVGNVAAGSVVAQLTSMAMVAPLP